MRRSWQRLLTAAALGATALAAGCDPAEQSLELPGKSFDDRECRVVFETPDAFGTDIQVVAAMFDGPTRSGAWAVTKRLSGPANSFEVRRRPANGGETSIPPEPLEDATDLDEYRFVEGTSPGVMWLERDRKLPVSGGEVVPVAFDIWKLDPSNELVPVFYKPDVEDATTLAGEPSYYNFRLLQLDGTMFMLAVPNESTPANFISFCNAARDPFEEAITEAVYLCFFPLSEHDLTLGAALEAGPALTAPGFRFEQFDIGGISNLRSTGIAMVPFENLTVPKSDEFPDAVSNKRVSVAKLRAINGVPVITREFQGFPLGSTEFGPLPETSPINIVQDDAHAYVYANEVKPQNDGHLVWNDVLAFDWTFARVIEEDIHHDARLVQLGDGPAFAWEDAQTGSLWIQEFAAGESVPEREPQVFIGEAQQVYQDPEFVAAEPAGAGHFILRHSDGRDALVRIECEG